MIPRRVLLLAMACTLLTGSDAQADSILEIQFDTPRGTLHIGPATPRGPFAYLTIPDDEISTLYCSPPVRIGCGPSFDVHGEINFMTGPLLDVSYLTDDEGIVTSTLYSYGSGQLEIEVFRGTRSAPVVIGTYRAPVPAFVLTVEHEDEHFAFFPEVLQNVAIGAGTFDAALARALGVQQQSPGGNYFMAYDSFERDPNLSYRSGTDNVSGINIQVIAVPEPVSALLLGVGATAYLLRRRFKRPPR